VTKERSRDWTVSPSGTNDDRLLFVGNGTQKLFGWFGGEGLEGTGAFFEHLGFRPGRRYALAAGAAEAGGGLLFALGAATPLAAAAISGSMITAIKTVHWKKGVWVSGGGYEYNLVLLAAVFGLTENGPGEWSVDAAVGRTRWGTAWAFAALAAGAAGSAAALTAAERQRRKRRRRKGTDPPLSASLLPLARRRRRLDRTCACRKPAAMVVVVRIAGHAAALAPSAGRRSRSAVGTRSRW
jgi:putative oxidoreductase